MKNIIALGLLAGAALNASAMETQDLNRFCEKEATTAYQASEAKMAVKTAELVKRYMQAGMNQGVAQNRSETELWQEGVVNGKVAEREAYDACQPKVSSIVLNEIGYNKVAKDLAQVYCEYRDGLTCLSAAEMDMPGWMQEPTDKHTLATFIDTIYLDRDLRKQNKEYKAQLAKRDLAKREEAQRQEQLQHEQAMQKARQLSQQSQQEVKTFKPSRDKLERQCMQRGDIANMLDNYRQTLRYLGEQQNSIRVDAVQGGASFTAAQQIAEQSTSGLSAEVKSQYKQVEAEIERCIQEW